MIKGKLPTLPSNSVAIPEAYYKIVYRQHPKPSAIAFLCPNKDSRLSIEKYVVSVDKVESETGLDFFVNISSTEQKALESTIVIRDWF